MCENKCKNTWCEYPAEPGLKVCYGCLWQETYVADSLWTWHTSRSSEPTDLILSDGELNGHCIEVPIANLAEAPHRIGWNVTGPRGE